jgi:hypothetical protein
MSVAHESHIKGAFRGWAGRDVYRLEDGSVREQVSYAYKNHYMYRPEAKIPLVRGRFFLEVDGMDGQQEVRRVPPGRLGRCQ